MKALWVVVGAVALLVVMALAGGVGRIAGKAAVEAVGRVNREDTMVVAQSAAAALLKANLPMRIDEATVWTGVSAEGAILKYNYTVERSRADLPNSMARELNALIVGKVCGNEKMRQTLSLGGAYRYLYVDASGSPIADFTVDLSSC